MKISANLVSKLLLRSDKINSMALSLLNDFLYCLCEVIASYTSEIETICAKRLIFFPFRTSGYPFTSHI